MAISRVAGIDSHILIGKEDPATYGTAVATDKNLGFIKSCDLSMRNKMHPVKSMGGGRNAVAYKAGNLEIDLTIELDLQTGHFFEYFLGANSDSGAAAPWLHTMTEANARISFSLENGFELGTTDMSPTYAGCILNTVVLRGGKSGPISATLGIWAQTVLKDTSNTAVTLGTDEAFMGHEASWELPDASALANVDSWEVTFDNGYIRDYDCGSRLMNPIPGERKYTIRLWPKMLDSGEYESFLGATNAPAAHVIAKIATAELNITNSGAAAAEKHIAILFTDVWSDEYSVPQTYGALLVQGITIYAESCGILCQDAFATIS